MPRPRKFDEIKVLFAIEDLFWRQGYELTSYADLMQVSGLGKGSLYAAFGDKQALYLKALGAYIEREVGKMGAELVDQGQAGKARIAHFLNIPVLAVEVDNDRRGCFLCNTAVELAPHDPAVANLVKGAMVSACGAIQVALNECGSTQATADGVLAAHLGIRVLAKGGADLSSLTAARDHALSALA